MRRRYELTDREWEVVQMFLPPVQKSQGGRPSKNRRQMLNAVLWVALTGAPWRDLPDYYGPWSSVYSFFWGRHKRGASKQAIGRSRGGLTTKIHAVVDALGNPL
ncbi:hypothetical protein D1872_188330 [compost metagenome]